MNATTSTDLPPRLRLLGLVSLAGFQAPAVVRAAEPLAVHRGTAAWFRENIACATACPLATDVPRYVALVADGRFDDAFAVNREANLFPSLLCLVCPRPCETACRRGLIDEPVAVRELKRTAAEQGESRLTRVTQSAKVTGKRVAVIGSGPAGMAAALVLREWGHAVAVFEGEQLGGMLASAIPDYRLSSEVVRAQWQALQEGGVEVHAPVRVGTDVALQTLLTDHDAVLVATGCPEAVLLDLPGRHLPQVHAGLDFMKRAAAGMPMAVGERALVVGAGLVGLDCARRALRLGARAVTVVELLPEDWLTYDPEERDLARAEGVEFVFETTVTRIVGEGEVQGVETSGADPAAGNGAGLDHRFWTADTVIIAVGQRAQEVPLNGHRLAPPRGPAAAAVFHPAGWPEGLFAAGDFVSGPSSVAAAIRSGRDAAAAVHTHLTGDAPPTAIGRSAGPALWTADTLGRRLLGHDDYDRTPRQRTWRPAIAPDGGVRVLEPSYGPREAQLEAQRCLQCQLNVLLDPADCILCGRCAAVCPYGCLQIVERASITTLGGDAQAPELQAAGGWPDAGALVIDEERCIRCGLCVDRCPNGCLRLEDPSAAVAVSAWAEPHGVEGGAHGY